MLLLQTDIRYRASYTLPISLYDVLSFCFFSYTLGYGHKCYTSFFFFSFVWFKKIRIWQCKHSVTFHLSLLRDRNLSQRVLCKLGMVLDAFNPSTKRERHAVLCEFKVSLVDIASPRTCKSYIVSEILSQKRKTVSFKLFVYLFLFIRSCQMSSASLELAGLEVR